MLKNQTYGYTYLNPSKKKIEAVFLREEKISFILLSY